MKKLTVIRSASGGGKSFLAQSLVADHLLSNKDDTVVIHNTDSIWMSETYDYNTMQDLEPSYKYYFIAELLYEAHKINLAKARLSMEHGINLIIIDNTNLDKAAYGKYVELAVEFDYELEVKRPDTPWFGNVDEHFKRNSHNVPIEVIRRQIKKLEDNPDQLVYDYYNRLKKEKEDAETT